MKKPIGLYTDYCITYQNYGFLFLPVTGYEISVNFASKYKTRLWMISLNWILYPNIIP
jgi:hypothetical protein